MKKKNLKIIGVFILLTIVFVFRFFMGLSKFSSHDEFQIYLIGLQSYTTGIFPYFGPDVVYTQSQIPGGLQGLLISLPIQWLKIPEAPYLLLNLMTYLVLVFFGWYLSVRVSNVPKWFIYAWLLTCPWTLHYSTHIENPSYVLIGAILFFIAVFELGKFYKTKLLDDRLSFAFLGFSIFWIMQLHLSWVLLPPYLLWIIWINKKDRRLLLQGFLFFLAGSLVSISTLIPSLLKGYMTGGVENNIVFHFKNILEFPNIFLRFLSFASYEIPIFIGATTSSRLDYLLTHIWMIPFILFLFLTGVFQVFYFIYSFFRKNESEEWNRVRFFTFYSLILLFFSFLFSISEPRSHTLYIMFPIAMWYSFYCYGNLFKYRIKVLSVIFLLSGIIFQASLFVNRFQSRSLFAHRVQVDKAISDMDYTFLGIRRESLLMKSKLENLWQKNRENSNTIFTTGFEVKETYFKPQNLVNNIRYDGKYSCKIDSIQPFGVTFNQPLSGLNNPKVISLSFYAKSNRIQDFLLVYEVKEPSENHWKGEDLEGKYAPNEKWQFIQLELKLPVYINKESQLIIYFWMKSKSGGILYTDNLKLSFN